MAERRDFLRKVAAAGTGAFALSMIVTVDPADAQALTSPPPKSPERPSPPDTAPAGSSRPGAPSPSPGAGLANPIAARRGGGRTELPRTGANLDRLTAAGLAATAGGAALVLWSADRRATTSTSPAGAKTTGAPSTTDTGTTHTGTTGTEPGT
jgi:hypothetical protein